MCSRNETLPIAIDQQMDVIGGDSVIKDGHIGLTLLFAKCRAAGVAVVHGIGLFNFAANENE
jgi:hypothetical protein